MQSLGKKITKEGDLRMCGHSGTTQANTAVSNKQDGYCVCKVTLRCVRATIVVVEKQWVLHDLSVCVCSLKYPACNVYAPYCHLLPAPLYNIFPNYLINGKIFEKKKLLNLKYVCWFSLQLLSETFLVIPRIQRDMVKILYCFSRKVPVILVPLPEDPS
jgi:hypothetical protein